MAVKPKAKSSRTLAQQRNGKKSTAQKATSKRSAVKSAKQSARGKSTAKKAARNKSTAGKQAQPKKKTAGTTTLRAAKKVSAQKSPRKTSARNNPVNPQSPAPAANRTDHANAARARLTREQQKARDFFSIEIQPLVLNKPLTAAQARELLDILRREKNRLMNDLDDLQRLSLNGESENGNGHDGYSIHPAESASDYQMREMTLLQNSVESQMLEMINESLSKHQAGIFGICSRCSAYIGYLRLKAKPWARLCIECRNAIERGKV